MPAKKTTTTSSGPTKTAELKADAAPKAEAPKTCPRHPYTWQQAAARRRAQSFVPHPDCTCTGAN